MAVLSLDIMWLMVAVTQGELRVSMYTYGTQRPILVSFLTQILFSSETLSFIDLELPSRLV